MDIPVVLSDGFTYDKSSI